MREEEAVAGVSRGWLRPLAWAVAAVYWVSWVFPLAAGLVRDVGSLPPWWGPVDIGLAGVLAVLVLVLLAGAERRVERRDREASYGMYRVLHYGILGALVVFFVAGDRVVWIRCLTGFVWRYWLLLYSLPAWLAALREGRPPGGRG